jgi:hypothetical protein
MPPISCANVFAISADLSLHHSAALLSSLFRLDLVVLIFALETKGPELPT